MLILSKRKGLMMSRGFFKNYIRLRRKNDSVKIISLLIIFLVIMVVCTIKEIFSLYRDINTPVEYEAAGILKNIESDNIIALSKTKKETLTLRYKADEVNISYVSVSEEYLSRCYGIADVGSMRTLYMNEKAYNKLISNLNPNNYILAQPEKIEKLDILDDDKRVVGTVRICVTDIPYHDEEFIVSKIDKIVESDIKGKDEPSQFMVLFSKKDLDGANLRMLEGMGLSIADTEKVKLEEAGFDLRLTRIKYDLIIIGLLAFFVGIMLGKHKSDSE